MNDMRQFLTLSLLAALSAAVWATPPPAQKPHRLMMIVSKKLPGIAIYDADTEQLVCRAKVGALSPHEGAFSPDGKYAYVSVYGSSGVGKPGTDEHILHFIRTSDCEEIGVLDTGENKRPHGIEVGQSGTIYLTTETSQSVLLIDPTHRRIIGKIPTDSSTSHMLAVTPDEKTAYTANVQSKTVSVLDVPGRKLAKVIQTETEPQRMALSPNQRWFVTNLGPEHKIAFYRRSDNQLDFTIPINGVPFVAEFSSDGKYLYDAGTEQEKIRVWKIDVGQRKVVSATNEELGKAIGSLEVNPFNRNVYLTSSDLNKLSEIDAGSWKVKKQFSTDQTPDCIAFITVK